MTPPRLLSRRERGFRRVIRVILRAVLPDSTFLRLFGAFLRWRSGGRP